MKFANLSRGELLATLGGVILAISVFAPWYGTDSSNRNSNIDGKTGDLSAWQVHTIMRLLLLAAAAAPFILAWIVIREHELSWPRGQVTAVVAIAATGLILYAGVIGKPGDPPTTIGKQYGWYLAVCGGLLMLIGSFMRQTETEAARKPPGVL